MTNLNPLEIGSNCNDLVAITNEWGDGYLNPLEIGSNCNKYLAYRARSYI